jgi:hemerythrin
MPIKWRDELSIDHGSIDQDHHTLIAIINAFESIEPGPAMATDLEDVLRKLERYATVHFEREEDLQRKVAFPYAQGHGQQHRHLLRSLSSARAEFAAAASAQELGEFRQHMFGFLHDWLLDHIVQNDLLMKPYVRAMAPHAELIGSLHAAVRAMAG